MRKLVASLVLFLVIGCNRANAPVSGSGAVDDPRFVSLMADLQQEMAAHDIPGASIAIVEDGQLTAAAGVGYKRRGDPYVVTPATRFRVASLSKMVTAAAALRLVEEGKLDLSRPVTGYVPLQTTIPETITMQQLLTHTAGLPDVGAATICPVGAGRNAAWFASVGALTPWTPPGAVWNYCNRGFAAAGWIVEAVSGEPFEQAITERVLAPAGMTTATYDLVATMAGDHATGTSGTGALEEPDAYDCAATRPASGILATPIDYAHFAETLFAGGGTMLTPSSVAALTTGYADTGHAPGGSERYGYGLFVRDGYKGLHIIHHDGEVDGWRSDIWMVPDRRFAVIVFYNAEQRSPSHVVERAIDLYLGVADVAAPVLTTPTADWARYVGRYVDPVELGAVDVTLDGASLHAAFAGGDVPLTQEGGDEFNGTFDGAGGSVTFYPSGAEPDAWIVTRRGVAARR